MRIVDDWQNAGIFLLTIAIFLVSPVHYVLEKWDAGSMISIHVEDHGAHQPSAPSNAVEDIEYSCMQQDCVISASLALPGFIAIHSALSAFSFYARHYSTPDLKPPSVSMV